jgi:cytoskeletal protein CcmA (bactofilin family)
MLGKQKRIEENNSKQGINLINEGTQLKGSLVATGDVRLDGQLLGDIVTAGRLAMGASGKIEGKIQSAHADVAGKVKGDMVVSDTLTLRSTAQIQGDIKVGKLVIEEGATFSGNCTMTNKLKSVQREDLLEASA